MMNWLEPWYASNEAQLVSELSRETSVGHLLWRVPVRVIGRRADCDDVLFGLEDGSGRVAVVHLTYSRETNPAWPRVEMFSDFERFASIRMKLDNENFDI